VRPELIIVPQPHVRQNLSLKHAPKKVHVQKLVPNLAVETLDERVLPRTPRLDIQSLAATLEQPILDPLRDELRTIVAPQIRGGAPLRKQRSQTIDDLLRIYAPVNPDPQTFPGILVNYIQKLQAIAGDRPVFHKVVAPDLVQVFSLLQNRAARNMNTLPGLAPPKAQALMLPDPLYPLMVYVSAPTDQKRLDPRTPITLVTMSQDPNLFP